MFVVLSRMDRLLGEKYADRNEKKRLFSKKRRGRR